MIPVFFLKLIVQLCTNRIGNILHINCIALHMPPNMANITQLHGYMKREHLELELDMINNMNGPMTLTPRYQDGKHETIHLQSRGAHFTILCVNTCIKKNTFAKLNHQNGSKFYNSFSRVDIHGIYYIVKSGNQN